MSLASHSFAADWPITSDTAPTQWSVARDENIAWKITLPETGQNTPVVDGDQVYFSTMKPVDGDSQLGSDIVAWCCDAKSGDVLWKRDIAAEYPLRLSGCFGDSTSPPAVCDGERVVFINASGKIACFDRSGKPLWSKEILSVSRTLPFHRDGQFVFTRQVYPPEPDGNFGHQYADSPLPMWTQLQSLDIATGEVVWTSECGVNMGCAVLPQKLNDGRDVAVVGRGGGHGPPEKPDGVSLVDLRDGRTLWSFELPAFMATQSFRVRDDEVHLFHEDEHLTIDAHSGHIVRRNSILKDVSVRKWDDGTRVTQTETIPGKSSRMITQTSNLLMGPYHYFRSYTQPYLGRVQVETGAVEYLELPLQLSRGPGKPDSYCWFQPPKNKKEPQLKDQAIAANEVKNSRGFVVMGDKRSTGNGWGHIAAPTPSVAGPYLYVPVMNGTVYVIDWNAAKLDESAVIAINDLGPAGESYTRASLSFAKDRIFAHTIRELICIGLDTPVK
ncbi:PQQ-binding-like beta-propeller repeat protein [Novipirellula sp. SH528]|uniref:outer membrane protein assembly factor BamB family protein n=1 Tax=Novipirellula sp. SH528 TaxID=3454466 RepID=UPI003FA178AD